MWVIGSIAGVAGLVVVVAALLADAPARPAPRASLGSGLPRPAEVARSSFPLAWRGYDPRVVDAHLREVATRYEALYLAAGPSVIARAEATLEPASHAAEPVAAAPDDRDRDDVPPGADVSREED